MTPTDHAINALSLILLFGCARPTVHARPPADRVLASTAAPSPGTSSAGSAATPRPPEVVQRLCGKCHVDEHTPGWNDETMTREEAAHFIRHPSVYGMPAFGEDRLSNEGLDVVIGWLDGLGKIGDAA